MKKLIPFLFSIILLSGCDSVNVNERLFVEMMGLSQSDGVYELTVQTAAETEDGKPQLFTGRGSSFEDAAESIMREEGKSLFFGHCAAVFLDHNIISDTERLKALAGKRVSVGCPVIYSESPALSAGAKGSDDELVTAQQLRAVLERYRSHGLPVDSTLKDMCSVASGGKPEIVPMYAQRMTGTAIVAYDGIFPLNMSESTALGILEQNKGVTVTAEHGSVCLDKPEVTVYFRQSTGECTVDITSSCTAEEISRENDLARQLTAAQNSTVHSVTHLLERAYADRFLQYIKGFEQVKGDNISFKVSCRLDEG